jgi:hypothetical protein
MVSNLRVQELLISMEGVHKGESAELLQKLKMPTFLNENMKSGLLPYSISCRAHF